MTPWLHHSAWLPCTAPLTSGTAHRSAELLQRIVVQFQVETAKRYQAANGQTFCNIFVWDVTRALGCELPHWVQAWNSQQAILAAEELTANKLAKKWLPENGPLHGWEHVPEESAREAAQAGRPAIAIWVNPAGPGHVAILVPPIDPTKTEIAQAGRTNFSRGSLAKGFGTHSVSFYTHA